MDRYVTGAAIRRLREKQGLTQAQLAEKLFVSDKTVSKWETGNGYPDITLLEPLASALRVSVAELLSGVDVVNRNRAFNMLRARLYVCPLCGNVTFSAGEEAVSCCGIALVPLEAEEPDGEHCVRAEVIGDEYCISSDHAMSKEHYLSFYAAFADNGVQIAKLYPESEATAYFRMSRVRKLYAYCNRHGLFAVPLPERKKR